MLGFSVFCGRNTSMAIFLKFYFLNLSVRISCKFWYLRKMARYQLESFLICSVIIYVCSGSSNSTTKTWYLSMDCVTYYDPGRRLGAEFGGQKKFREPNFRMTFFRKKFPVFDAENKILVTFLVIAYILSVFCLSLLSEIWYITYMTLFFTNNLYLRTKNSFITLFFNQFVLCHASNNTISPNIGRTDAWTVPHLKFWGNRPPIPLRLRSCIWG